jgi:serine/threonine protein kinase
MYSSNENHSFNTRLIFEQGNLGGNQIAVKQLTHHKRLNVSTDEFEREMGILMDVKHKNLVKFLAYCNKGDDRFLCFEFLSGGSLDMLLHGMHELSFPCFSTEFCYWFC